MPEEMTFADIDRLEAERQQKARDCVERLSKVLAKEFSFEELRFVQYYDPAILIEAFEIARTKGRRECGVSYGLSVPASASLTQRRLLAVSNRGCDAAEPGLFRPLQGGCGMDCRSTR